MQFIIQYSSDYVYVFFLRPSRADNSSPEAIEIPARPPRELRKVRRAVSRYLQLVYKQMQLQRS